MSHKADSKNLGLSYTAQQSLNIVMEPHYKHKYIQYTGKKCTNVKSICFLKVIIYSIYLSTAAFPLYAQSYTPTYTKLVDLCTKSSTSSSSQEGRNSLNTMSYTCCKALGFPFCDKKEKLNTSEKHLLI